MSERLSKRANTKAEPLPGPATFCNAAALRAASRRLSQVYDDTISACGLRGTQYSVLNRIDRRGSVSLNDLASDLAMDRSTLGHNLRPLERDGFVVLGRDPQDRRTRVISLSSSGKRKLAEARPLWAKAHARFETTFGATRAAQLRALLVEIASDDFVAALSSG
jgi:DNA-binding MarR family transcriptional regulator